MSHRTTSHVRDNLFHPGPCHVCQHLFHPGPCHVCQHLFHPGDLLLEFQYLKVNTLGVYKQRQRQRMRNEVTTEAEAVTTEAEAVTTEADEVMLEDLNTDSVNAILRLCLPF